MADDAQDPQVEPNEEVQDQQVADPQDPPEPDEPSEEVEKPESQEPGRSLEETPEEPAVEEERPPSRRESLRIQKLVEKLKQQPREEQYAPQGMDYRKTINAEDEIINQLETDRQNVGQSAYNEGLSQAQSIQWRTALELDNPKVENKYPQLNKESDEFNPAAADAINSWYLASVGYNPQSGKVSNPNIRYSDFVEGIMELADEMAGAKVEKTSRNIAQQAATTGLRPDGSSAKRLDLSKAPEDMSNEELDAVINSSLKK